MNVYEFPTISKMNIVQKVFEEVRQKIPPPQAQTPYKAFKGGLFQNQNKPMNQSQNLQLQNTPTNSKVKITSTPKLNASQRVPKTPSPIRTSRNSPMIKSPPSAHQPHDNQTDIKVFLRVKPLLNEEDPAEFNFTENSVVTHPQSKDTPSQNTAERKFMFTKVFGENSYQDDIFVDVAMPMLKQFVRGNDSLIFAYGAAKTGKTFTVRGSESDPGLIPRIIKSILGMEKPQGFERGLYLSCVEIYNERIQDLLVTSKIPLRVTKDGFGSTTVKNATEKELKSYDDLKNILSTVDKSKSKSHSHCIYTLKLVIIPIDQRTKQRVTDLSKITTSRLSIVDLAGSERAGNSNEARSVNKSILTLGKCIRGIQKHKIVQIPFRESKITEMFRDFFDPSCSKKTFISIIINISRNSKQFDDTLNSLQFCSSNSLQIASSPELIQNENKIEENEENQSDDNEEEDVVNLIEAEAKIRQQVYSEMMTKMKEFQENQTKQLRQTKAHSAQEYPNKLQAALQIRAVGDTQRRELEEFNKEIERLSIGITEKDAHLANLNDKLRQMELTLRAVMQDTQDKLERKLSLEERAQRIIAAAQKLKNDISELMELHGRKMMQLKNQHEKEISQKMARGHH